MRGLRSLAYGLLAVILGIVLAGEGFSPAAIGLLVTVSLVGDMVGTYVIGLVAHTRGPPPPLALLPLLLAGDGAVFGFAANYGVLLGAAFLHPVSEHQTASYPSTASFPRHRVEADCALQRGCAGRRTGGAKPDGALLSSALWCATDNTLRPVLWGQSSLGALVPGSSAAGSAFRPTQHNGLHAPALECPLDPGSLRAHVSPGGNAAAVAPGAFADGCSHPAGLHDGPGRPVGALGRPQRYHPGSQPGLLHQPGLLRPAAARSPAHRRVAIHSGRDTQSRL